MGTLACKIFSKTIDNEPDIIDGVGAKTGHVIRTNIGGQNGQSRQILLCHHLLFKSQEGNHVYPRLEALDATRGL
ncbi:hypothetical protein Ahy_A09g046272 isoform B [Arachis hypogaea]|uniref:Uncharacterized protein n=1 Tax=Arachis hypogaea TaxID=3818 RepID=A0A445BPF0_ARAHY|nr:hypothetical protein Ahy_A09g046272 isoform B [Arachis hypogaea]